MITRKQAQDALMNIQAAWPEVAQTNHMSRYFCMVEEFLNQKDPVRCPQCFGEGSLSGYTCGVCDGSGSVVN